MFLYFIIKQMTKYTNKCSYIDFIDLKCYHECVFRLTSYSLIWLEVRLRGDRLESDIHVK